MSLAPHPLIAFSWIGSWIGSCTATVLAVGTMSLSVYAKRSSPNSSLDEENEQGRQVPRKIREETEAICYEFCDQKGQEDGRLSAEERARLHESTSECIRRVCHRSDGEKRAVEILLVRKMHIPYPVYIFN